MKFLSASRVIDAACYYFDRLASFATRSDITCGTFIFSYLMDGGKLLPAACCCFDQIFTCCAANEKLDTVYILMVI